MNNYNAFTWLTPSGNELVGTAMPQQENELLKCVVRVSQNWRTNPDTPAVIKQLATTLHQLAGSLLDDQFPHSSDMESVKIILCSVCRDLNRDKCAEATTLQLTNCSLLQRT